MFRYEFLFNRYENVNVESYVEMVQDKVNMSAYTDLLRRYFQEHRLKPEIVLATSVYEPPMNSVINNDDIEKLCVVKGSKGDIFFGPSRMYSPAYEVPAKYEGLKDAIAIRKGERRTVELPHTTAGDNARVELLSIHPDFESNELKLQRTTTLRGHAKEGPQDHLLLMEDFYNYERRFYNEGRSLKERFEDIRASRKAAEELEAAFANARKKQKDEFLKEAKDWLEVDITDMKDEKVVSPGVRHTDPDFVYSTSFEANSLLKKAGNNYIVEVGKLIGNPTKPTEQQRARPWDIYALHAKTIRTELVVDLPAGYTAEGLQELNKTVTNEVGTFTTNATLAGNQVKITVEKVYNAAHYPEKNWKDMLAIMDAAAEWTGSRILLRKG
jgi:hypothetical protein